MMKVLVCLKDNDLLNKIKNKFDEFKIEADYFSDGISAKNKIESYNYECLILQDTISSIDGISLTKYIRGKNTKVFIYIIGSRNTDYDVSYALTSGANDYIVDPINIDNFVLKVNNLLMLSNNRFVHIGNIDIDTDARILYVDGQEKDLTLKEFKLLKYLIENKGKAVSREAIFKDVWEYDCYALDDRTIDTHIKMLRNELGPYKDYIETYRGFGYKFEVK